MGGIKHIAGDFGLEQERTLPPETGVSKNGYG